MHFIALESNQRMVPYIIFHHRLTPQKTTELLKKTKHKMFAVPFDIQDDCPIKWEKSNLKSANFYKEHRVFLSFTMLLI
jgi:hypothetical protein